MAEESICCGCFHSYVCEQFNEHRNSNNQKCHFFNDHFVSAADVVEVKHGRWVWVAQRFLDGGYIDIFRCSECLVPDGKKYRYCPNCGARMDGGNE